MSDSTLSSSITSSHFGVISASSDSESRSGSTSHMSDSDYEVVLITQATAILNISDSDSGSLVDPSTDFVESSDDEHIFVPNVSQSAPNTPRPPSLVPQPLNATPRPISAVIAHPIVESEHNSDADREDDSSVDSSYDSDSDDGSIVHARPRIARLDAPVAASASTATLMAYPNANASATTIRPAPLSRPATARRSTPAGMHAPAITTNTIVGIIIAAPLSPPTPSDGGEIPYVPFTPAPTAVSVSVSNSAAVLRPAVSSTTKPSTPQKPSTPAKKPSSSSTKNLVPSAVEPAIPKGKVSKRVWSAMNRARLALGFEPLEHALRKKRNKELKAAKRNAPQETQPKAQAQPKPKASAKAKKGNKAVKAVGASPVTSEDEAPRMRASMFSSGVLARSESPDDEAAYDAAIQQLNDHMSSPPEHPTATYRYILNRALLLEFRVCTPDTLPTSHGAAIAMVKSNIHINVLDYVAKRKEGFGGLRSVMLENAKALRKDVRKRKMPVKQVKSLGLHSLLIARH